MVRDDVKEGCGHESPSLATLLPAACCLLMCSPVTSSGRLLVAAILGSIF